MTIRRVARLELSTICRLTVIRVCKLQHDEHDVALSLMDVVDSWTRQDLQIMPTGQLYSSLVQWRARSVSVVQKKGCQFFAYRGESM